MPRSCRVSFDEVMVWVRFHHRSMIPSCGGLVLIDQSKTDNCVEIRRRPIEGQKAERGFGGSRLKGLLARERSLRVLLANCVGPESGRWALEWPTPAIENTEDLRGLSDGPGSSSKLRREVVRHFSNMYIRRMDVLGVINVENRAQMMLQGDRKTRRSKSPRRSRWKRG